MIYEVVNPSDTVTFEADDLAIARAAVLLVGRGQYGIIDEKENRCGGMLFFIPEEESKKRLHEWFGCEVSDFIDSHKEEIAVALASFATVSRSARQTYIESLAAIEGKTEREARQREFQERNRTSLNDITGYAWRLAAQLRGEPEDNTLAPRSLYPITQIEEE